MNNISINNIFSPGSGGNEFRPLDVNNLSGEMSGVGESSDAYSALPGLAGIKFPGDEKHHKGFNLERLIHLREERRVKILAQYEKIYNMVLNKITLANNLNKTELVYEVPDVVFGHYDYNSLDCINYIDIGLKKMFIDTIVLSDKTIYISWLNLDKNIRDGKTEQ